MFYFFRTVSYMNINNNLLINYFILIKFKYQRNKKIFQIIKDDLSENISDYIKKIKATCFCNKVSTEILTIYHITF